MFWAKKRPVCEATTDFGEIAPVITLTSFSRSRDDGFGGCATGCGRPAAGAGAGAVLVTTGSVRGAATKTPACRAAASAQTSTAAPALTSAALNTIVTSPRRIGIRFPRRRPPPCPPAGFARSDLVRRELQPVPVRVGEVDRVRDAVVLELRLETDAQGEPGARGRTSLGRRERRRAPPARVGARRAGPAPPGRARRRSRRTVIIMTGSAHSSANTRSRPSTSR